MSNDIPTRISEGIANVLAELGEPNVDPFALTHALLQAGWTPPGAEHVESGVDGPEHWLFTTTAEHVLELAREEMRDRAASRDTEGGERSMARAVAGFNALYGAAVHQRLRQGLPALSETHGWEFMSILKKARGAVGRYRADDYTEDVAYSALAAESANDEREQR